MYVPKTSPRWVDVAVRRWEGYASKKAQLIFIQTHAKKKTERMQWSSETNHSLAETIGDGDGALLPPMSRGRYWRKKEVD
jgi:hypothetical protein